MSDLGTMLWKEFREVMGHKRSLRVLGIAVLFGGVLPLIEGHAVGKGAAEALFGLLYLIIAPVIVAAQTSPDLVLRERSGRTLETLLASRLPDQAIFGGKVLTSAAISYGTALLALIVQIVGGALIHGHWSWSYLALGPGRLFAFGGPAVLAVYLAVIGTFVALRVGDQRSAYFVTMLSLAVLALPLVLGLVHLHLTLGFLAPALGTIAVADLILLALGVRFFQRERIILMLQE